MADTATPRDFWLDMGFERAIYSSLEHAKANGCVETELLHVRTVQEKSHSYTQGIDVVPFSNQGAASVAAKVELGEEWYRKAAKLDALVSSANTREAALAELVEDVLIGRGGPAEWNPRARQALAGQVVAPTASVDERAAWKENIRCHTVTIAKLLVEIDALKAERDEFKEKGEQLCCALGAKMIENSDLKKALQALTNAAITGELPKASEINDAESVLAQYDTTVPK